VGLGAAAGVLAELADVSRFGAARAVAAAARRTIERRVGAEPPGTYLAPRADAIHRILTRHGSPAPAYVFGHNHRAERLDLPGPPDAAYLNAGTWGPTVRGRGPDQVDRQLFPYVRIAGNPGRVDADVLFWTPGC
jgi:hypothetical protein